MYAIAIETSCDETSVAIVDDKRNILSNVTYSQIAEHQDYGGVVPEIAARSHIDKIEALIHQSLKEAKFDSLSDIDVIGVTSGPGLIGGLIVGVMVAKSIASIIKKPIIAINHLEGHILTANLTNNTEFPYLLFLLSGGHSQIILVKNVGQYEIIGETIDDSFGEAFDKVAKMMGLNYPGGPEIEKRAEQGNPHRFNFPMPLCNKADDLTNFSLSGLKTSVRNTINAISDLTNNDINDIAASFQYTVTRILENRLENTINILKKQNILINKFVLAGGVAANKYIREKLTSVANKNQYEFIAPPIKLCTDNAAMIGWSTIMRAKLGLYSDINFIPKARWEINSSDLITNI